MAAKKADVDTGDAEGAARSRSVPRWTQVEAALRLLRGVDASELAAEFDVTVEELTTWRDEFLEAGMRNLAEPAGAATESAAEPAVEIAPASAPAPAASPSWREQAGRRAHTALASPGEDAAVGLRERKKAKTRASIRRHAMRLYHEQGYYETTVNQIADAAEVSPSTFFRYFATKEDVVFQDDAEAQLSEAFRSVPTDLGPVQAIFRGLLDAMASTSDPEAVRQQVLLCLSVPELRAVLFDNLTQLMNEIAELVSTRVGRRADDIDIRTFSAAVQGVWYSVLFDWAEDPDVDLEAAMMRAATQLEKGLPL